MTSRREFLQYLLGATAVTAAGLVVPARTTYSFLLNNPLSDEMILREGLTATYGGYSGAVPLRHVWGRIAITKEMMQQPGQGAFARAFAFDEAQAKRVMDGLFV